MTGVEFCRWMDTMNLNTVQVRELFGLGRNTITKYREQGAPDYIGYACAAVSMGLPKWAGN